MENIDIIIPSLISYQKYPKFQKFQKFQLFQKYPFPSFMGNWFPVWYNRKMLKEKGITVHFHNYLNLKYKKLSKIVCIDSRIINNAIIKYGTVNETIRQTILPFLNRIRKYADYIIYFDNADSTGHFHNEVFPHVDLYLKKQLLKDFSLYTKSLYKKRLFTDFYAKNYDLVENYITEPRIILDSDSLNKIALSWNFALKDYRYTNIITRFLYNFIRNKNIKYFKPSLDRRLILAANFTIKPSYDVIYFQRNELLSLLKQKFRSNSNVSIGKIPKKKYLKTMRSSKSVISPFGWGEICYRDFETFIAGAALIKPSVEHLQTWPDVYKKNQTYIPISWKVENWDEELTKILDDAKLLLNVARKGQNCFKQLWTRRGRRLFCDHFIQMITPK
jgi:hypothetical protein